MERLAVRIAEFIEAQGHNVEVDELGDSGSVCSRLRFRSTGVKYYVLVSDADPMYFSVGTSSILPEGSDRAFLLSIAHEVCAGAKAIKIEVADTYVDFSIEQYLQTPNGFAEVFWRCVNAASDGARRFIKGVQDAGDAVTAETAATPLSDTARKEAFEAAGDFLRTLPFADTGDRT